MRPALLLPFFERARLCLVVGVTKNVDILGPSQHTFLGGARSLGPWKLIQFEANVVIKMIINLLIANNCNAWRSIFCYETINFD